MVISGGLSFLETHVLDIGKSTRDRTVLNHSSGSLGFSPDAGHHQTLKQGIVLKLRRGRTEAGCGSMLSGTRWSAGEDEVAQSLEGVETGVLG